MDEKSNKTLGDVFRDMRKDSQARRERNRQRSPLLLSEAGISFASRNMAAHLIVDAGPFLIDFWPGTGKWIARGGGYNGRGVYSLITLINTLKENDHDPD